MRDLQHTFTYARLCALRRTLARRERIRAWRNNGIRVAYSLTMFALGVFAGLNVA